MKISQREARRLKKRVAELEQVIERQHRSWAEEWTGGTVIGSLDVGQATYSQIHTARLLRHAVVVTMKGSELIFNACKLPNR